MIVRLLAALSLAAAPLAIAPAADAAGAFCSGSGVNVVVDFNGQGGGVQKACDPDGAGEDASSVFPHAGFALTYTQRQPGFVCRVNGVPQSDPCVNTPPTDAYWGLYWSDGDGAWHYSSAGVGALKVSDGGFVAFSWQSSSTKSPPGATPVNDQSSPDPQPSPQPSSQPSPPTSGDGGTHHHGSGGGTSGSGSSGSDAGTTLSATPLAGVPARHRHRADLRSGRRSHGSSSASASADATSRPSATPESVSGPPQASIRPARRASDVAARPDDHGLPGWVPMAVIGSLLAAGAGVTVLRRRAGGA